MLFGLNTHSLFGVIAIAEYVKNLQEGPDTVHDDQCTIFLQDTIIQPSQVADKYTQTKLQTYSDPIMRSFLVIGICIL